MEPLIEIESISEADTSRFAGDCLNIIKPGNVVELVGNLGTGKTYFVKEFCKLNGIEDSGSPSFAIVNEYAGKNKIYHFDFYRLKRAEELLDIGFYDYLNDTSAITFIEWGNMYEEVLPDKRIVINFEMLENDVRRISLYEQ